MTRSACIFILAVLLAALAGTGCRNLSEEEALELAQEEIRQEMQPEIDRREAEIERLEAEIARTRARIAEREAR